MKKTFKLKVDNKDDARQLETIKKEIRKYIKREKGKRLPEGVDYWFLKCKFGKVEAQAQEIKFADIMKNVDASVAAGDESFYLEILSTEGHRASKDEE